ncbi:ATP-binding protein [Psychromonas arctica]|uniref:ATP-binding protein n=1 Tax=Psychromonas arctica TaxID=168275 RepID=UPI00040642C5|nr:ATP-binding protein [Psychromonas arctica]
MIGRIFKGQSAKTRIALGLVSIVVCVSIGASFLGLFPDRYGAILAGRAAIAEIVAVNSSVFITRRDIRRMEANLNILVSRNDEILSAAVKPLEGKAVAIIGEHESQWLPMEEGTSTESQLVVPIWEGNTQWGHIELRFKPLKHPGLFAFFFEPLAQFIMFVSFFSFIFFKFYLGKVLKQLDPSQAIPGRVRSALDTMAEGLLVLDTKQNIVLANEAFSVLVGETPEALMGRSIGKFSWNQVTDLNREKNTLLNVQQKYPWEIALASSSLQMSHMLYLEIDENTRYTFMVNCSPVLGQNGKVAGMMVSFDDITALEEKEIELRRSKEEAETANRAKSDFLSNMSHEIRTPMNAILGFTEVLMRGHGNDPVESKRYLGTIASSGKHLLGLINDILDLSKVEAGKIEIETLPCAAHQIVQEVVKVMGVKAKEKGISLEFIAIDSMPDLVLTDAGKIRQILTNLVGNSIKFTEIGSVKLTTRYQSEKNKSRLVIEVSDTGIGMTQDQAETIFKPFVQADSSITRRFGGTGLGLTISKRFAEALGGDIMVTSETGKGSCFIVDIEVEAAPQAKLLSATEVMQEVTSNVSEQQITWVFPEANILVIDDGDENRDLLEVVLSDAGLSIETGVNGKQGLDMALARSYDLILMDVQMPLMDGYTAVRLMRENGITIPVIALTAHAMKGVESQCLAAGYSGYMTKPIDIDKLLKCLANELGGKIATTTHEAIEVSKTSLMVEEAVNDKKQISKAPKPAIYSSLPSGAKKYQSLIERFILRLHEQFILIEQAASIANYEQLADLAHWLKGSAGSVGFHDFTEPAESLETYAIAKDRAAIDKKVEEIKDLISRIEISNDHQTIKQETVKLETLTEEKIKQETEQLAIEQDTIFSGAVIRSTLLASTPKLKPIAEKFVLRLDEKIILMNDSLSQEDFATLADLAHWLKGSAGTIGFHDFTEPAIKLEASANENNTDNAKHLLEAIRQMANNIDLSDTPDKNNTREIFK